MSLTEYRRKRDFASTREPEPGKPLPKGRRAIFVVQLHHASRRHYDFRLQVGNTLKSWAVPKGPSLDPKVKRLAAEVEDHPVSYASFEGEIPKGEYGGGHVALFDRGVWSSDGDVDAQLAKGHLRFELFGERLKGGWHLVRSRRGAKQPEWLLFKEDDAHAGAIEADDLLDGVTPPPGTAASPARAAPTKPAARKRATATTAVPKAARRRRIDWQKQALALPHARAARAKADAFTPQLARLGTQPPSGDNWLHELKWDGYRLLATIVDSKAKLWSRNALDWTQKLPDIVAALEALGLKHATLDGELIAGNGAQHDFGKLQATLSGEQQAPLRYVLFDLLHLDGVAIDRAPLLARKELLARVLEGASPHLAYSSHWSGDGERALAAAAQAEFEGIISKRADQPYHGGRGDDWRKTKQVKSDEFAVVGYTAPKGARSGFGSLLLARPDPEHGWKYAGRVGSGFSDEQLRDLTRRIGKAGEREPSVHVDATDTDLRSARWFAPRFVVEVFSRGIGNQGLLRQPSLKAIRMDKNVEALSDTDAPVRRKRGRTETAPPVRISSPERVVFPDAGVTKQEVADYYAAVMDHLLPEIIGRPLSVVRCPDGIANACFFQKHLTAGIKHVAKVRLKEESGNHANYLVVQDAEAVMELVQFNALEFHPWGSTAKQPGRATRVVFDLDPGPGVAWSDVRKAARQVRDRLAELELTSFLRTSGGKGLHVVVPLNPGCDWDLVKRFARGFSEAMAQSEPERYVTVATKAKREGRIFLDYLRNGRGATSVASYSLRARAGAPVAVPLAWDELTRLKRSDAFDLRATLRRLARQAEDPWHGIDTLKQDLSRWSEPSRRKR
jgi:bifunctional non-homologous end joining protein LigD